METLICQSCYQEKHEVYPCRDCNELTCLECAVPMTSMNCVDFHICDSCCDSLE